MNRIRCIAVDDEPPALMQMEDYISKVDYLELQATFKSAIEALQFCKENDVDLLFLDIQMEYLTGMDFLKLLKNKPKVILTTAYDSYAIQAFDLEVSDYLLKPISFDRFFKAVDRVYNDLANIQVDKKVENQEFASRKGSIFIKTDSKTQRVDVEDILYVQGLKEYLIIQTIGPKYITLMNFSQILEKLPSQDFVRVHKSFIVAIDRIDHLHKNTVHIGEKSIPIGPSFRDDFHKRIDD